MTIGARLRSILLPTIALLGSPVMAQPCLNISDELIGSSVSGADQFGWSVDAQGDLVIVGSPDDDNSAGSVYITSYLQAGPADLNIDSTLNFFDISVFLTAYAAGCS